MPSIRTILILALIVRTIFPSVVMIIAGSATQFYDTDSYSYIRPAHNLIDAGKFQSQGHPEIIRTPGYPVLLIPSILANHILLVTIIIQTILSCITVYLIYLTGHLMFQNGRAASICALLYVFEPLSLFYSCRIMAETLFTFFLCLFFYLMLRYFLEGRVIHLCLAATFLAASAYTKPIGYYLPFVIFIVLILWSFRDKKTMKQNLKSAVIFFVVAAGLIGIWVIRNGTKVNYWGFSAYEGINSYFCKAASILAYKNGMTIYAMQYQMGWPDLINYFKAHPEQRSWTQAMILKFMRQEGIKIVLADPGIYSRIYAKGTIRVLFDPAGVDYLKLFRLYPQSGGLLGNIIDYGLWNTLTTIYHTKPLVFWINAMLGVFLILYYLCALVALLSPNILARLPVIILLSTVFYLILPVGEFGMSRYRHPVMPFLCILAGYGIALLLTKLHQFRNGMKVLLANRWF